MNKKPENLTDEELSETRRIVQLIGDGYVVPAPLLHKVLVGILTCIIFIGGYMVAWAYTDATFKSRVLTEMEFLRERVVEIGEDQDDHENRMHGNGNGDDHSR